MGASADQIEREIRETRERMDENLELLEDRAVSNAVRYGRIAAVALLVTAAGVAGFLMYRRIQRPGVKERLERLSPESLREFAVEIGTHVKERFPSVTVTVNKKEEPEPGPLQSILRRVAPTIIGSALTAVVEKLTRRPAERAGRRTAYE